LKSIRFLKEDNPLFLRILFSLFEMRNMDVINRDTLFNILERLVENYENLLDDYNQWNATDS